MNQYFLFLLYPFFLSFFFTEFLRVRIFLTTRSNNTAKKKGIPPTKYRNKYINRCKFRDNLVQKKKRKRSKHDKTVTKETTEKLWTTEERRVVLNHYSFYLPSWTDSFSPSILFPWKVTTGVSARITLLDTRDRNERQREREREKERGAIRKGRKSFIGEKKKRKVTYAAPDYLHDVSRALSLPSSPSSRSRFHPIEITTDEVAGRRLIPSPLPLCPSAKYLATWRPLARRERERERGKDEVWKISSSPHWNPLDPAQSVTRSSKNDQTFRCNAYGTRGWVGIFFDRI